MTQQKSISVNVTISPHSVEGKPRGYYVIVRDLFPNGSPILVRQQWIGFSEGLVITVEHNHQWDSLLKMAINCPALGERAVTWLAPAKMWATSKGFRTYVPGTILKPKSDSKCHYSIGYFKSARGDLYYIYLPEITGEILLGRKEL